jgi:valyl-tRNA synthetase
MLLSSPAGNDLLFDESLCEQGRNFCNKVWNAFRLVKGWEIAENGTQPDHAAIAIRCFNNRMNLVANQINDDFEKYRLSDALMAVYKLIWDDFCSYFLEVVKPPYQKPIDAITYSGIIDIFEK